MHAGIRARTRLLLRLCGSPAEAPGPGDDRGLAADPRALAAARETRGSPPDGSHIRSDLPPPSRADVRAEGEAGVSVPHDDGDRALCAPDGGFPRDRNCRAAV